MTQQPITATMPIEDANDRRRRNRGDVDVAKIEPAAPKGPDFPIAALRSSANGEDLHFEFDVDETGRNVVRVVVTRDGEIPRSIEFDSDHLQAFSARRINRDLFRPAWKAGLIGNWYLAGVL